MSITAGATVRQIVPAPIQGVVVRKQYIESDDSFQYLVETPAANAGDEPAQRWFDEKQIEVVEVVATPGA